ncbi:Chelated iron transport system membrane protein [Sodalis praecaptivus]|uniref:Chelated iron transport system membrane protein n=1 Tax=Sodalis praecaptivus TaxID=1239307 RepID=W0HUG6_9GAMM|nr:metal ABC transporter permease [Sodalis praecaptivus]AHF77471.1 Chelated iron transport system membrane protein [Sodalis praecaptivus]
MLEWAMEPLHYAYMRNAIGVSALVGAACAFLSAFVVLKGWSLMGDALSHSVMPGVAAAYALGLPYAAGAFVTGLLAALTMALTRHLTRLREDAIIGYVFSTFFAAGLLLVSLNPTAVNVQTILFGNILAIAAPDVRQVQWISGITFAVLFFLRKDLLAVFFDETHARSLGLAPLRLKLVFFVLLSASIIAALQTVGAILVMAMVITPGATAWLLTDRFSRLITLSVGFGAVTCAVGAWLSYFVDGATGGVIVTLQTLLFLLTWIVAPRHGLLAARRRRRAPQEVVR